MKISAYPLSDQTTALQPASEERAWSLENQAACAGLAVDTVNGKGWELLCPYGFEASWNGGPNAEDIEIRLETTDADQPGFVRSQLGGGILTFHSGYQLKTEDTHVLWVRGPINTPKDGLHPLERIVDTALLPCTITVNWTFTRPNQTVRFEAGEPFAGLLPYPKNAVENFETEVISPAADETDDEAAYEHMLQQMAQDAAVQSVFRRLQADDEPTAAPAARIAPTAELAATNGHWAAQLTDPPPVSCICPTYGRVELLEEAICSFLRQDYPGPKELIVLNDYAGQTLEFEHPDVRIINLPTRFRSVGEKYKAAVGFCSHDLIFVWHDDDIYLPHRLSFSVAHLIEKRGFFKADRAWFWNEGRVTGPDHNTFHGGSCFSRELFAATQGYPHISNRYDVGFEELCEDEHTGVTAGYRVQPEDIYYIYRWNGTGSYHLSLCAQDGHGHDQVAAYVQQHAAQGQIKQGCITLDPHWKTDYTALIQSHLNNGHAQPSADEIPFPPPFFAIPAPEPMPEEAAAALFRGTHPVRISVILPALNESVLLQRTVEQFEATLPPNSEIIVVDNGSNDGSADFLGGPGRPGVTLIQSPKPLGVAGARNRGLAEARGEVVVFADAHIDVPERWWQPIVATLNRPNVGVVGPGIGVMGRPEHPASCGQRIAERNLRVEWLPLERREPHPVPTLGGGFMAMRHETLHEAGAFDQGMPQWGSEDLELCVRYWLLGYEVWVVPEVTILHYFRAVNPLKVKQGIVTHNLLRVALLHFTQARIARVVAELQKAADFSQALAHTVESDVWQRRAALAGRRMRNDDWLFEKFADCCQV